VLRALLRRLWDARRCEPVRLPLTGALLEYLQLSRGPRLLRLPPAVLQAVLKGARWHSADVQTGCGMQQICHETRRELWIRLGGKASCRVVISTTAAALLHTRHDKRRGSQGSDLALHHAHSSG